jgi:hypothetical protein
LVSTLVSLVDALALGLGCFVGFVVSSSPLDSELVWAPPVLTTSPDEAGVVDPVEVDGVVSDSFGSVAVVAVSDVVADVAGDDSEDDVSEVSAHASPHPEPVTTAAPTPSATAKPPTRPTYIDERMVPRIRQQPMAPGVFAK